LRCLDLDAWFNWRPGVSNAPRNVGSTERAASALLGLALSTFALGQRGGLVRAASAAAGVFLLARAATGHCAVKAAFKSAADTSVHRHDMRGRAAASKAIDESLIETFPASDPPASRLPDVPPVNAAAKWAAARKAGTVER
jgi:hypothetical protein